MADTTARALVLCGAIGMALGLAGCASIVNGTQGVIDAQPAQSSWKLQKSTEQRVLACIKGPVLACEQKTGDSSGPAGITAATRIKVLREITSQYPITKTAILKGYSSFSALKEDVKTMSSGIETGQALLPPEAVQLILQLPEDSRASALAHKEDPSEIDVSDNMLAGSISAKEAAVINEACATLDDIRDNSTGSNENTLLFSISKDRFRECLNQTRDATALDGWNVLSKYYWYVLQNEAQKMKDLYASSDIKAVDKARIAGEIKVRETVLVREAVAMSFVSSYMKAYFNSGSVMSIDLTVGQLRQSALDSLKAKLPELSQATMDSLVDELLMQVAGSKPDSNGKYHLLVKKDNGGFVTRGGASYAFPGVAITIDPTNKSPITFSKVDLSQVGSDMMRVFLEGMGDGWALVPGDPKATGVSKDPKMLPAYDSNKYSVKEDQFVSINNWGNKAETVVGSAVGEAIRGISWISLNNEALAKMIETSAGVAARKGTEKLAWCYYSCTKSIGIAMEEAPEMSVNSVSLTIKQ